MLEISVVELPSEVAKRITFQELIVEVKVNTLPEGPLSITIGLYLIYQDDQSTYAITVGYKGAYDK